MMTTPFSPRISVSVAATTTLFLGVAGLSCALNQPVFVGSFAGRCAYGFLTVAALALAAWRARDAWALLPALFAAVVLMSPDALPYSFGVLLMPAAFILVRSFPRECAGKFGRAAACVAGLWSAYALARWIVVSVLPAMTAQAEGNRLAGEVWLTGTPWPGLVMPLGHANYTSGVGVILVPIFLGLAFRKNSGRLGRAGWGCFAVLAGVLIVAGGSRAGLLALPVALAGWLLLTPVTTISFKKKAGALLSGLVVTGGAALIHPHYRNWMSNPEAISYSDLIRRDYVEGCWAMFLEKPLTGWGAGALPANFAPFNPPGAEHVSCYHAHTTPVQWLVEFGVAGVLLYLALAVFSLAALWRVSRLPGSDNSVATGLVIAVFGYGVFSLFDYQANIPLLGVLWGAILGAVSRFVLPAVESKPGVGMQKIVRLILFAGAGYAALLVVLESPARREVVLAKTALDSDLPLAARRMADAAAAAPDNAAIHGYAAVVYDRFAIKQNSAAVAELSDKEWERASLAAPNFPQLKTYRALHLSPTDPRKAVSLFKESLRDGPKFAPAWRGLAEAYFRLGDRESVASVIALSLFVRPENAFDPVLQRGAFGVGSREVRDRFDSLVAEYEKELPSDSFARGRLAVVQKQIHAWYAAGRPVDFIRSGPAESDNPVRRLLSKRLPASADATFDRPAALRALTAAVFVTQDYTMNESEAGVLLDQYLGKSGAPFSGVRTVMTPESLLHFGSYLGVSDFAEIGFPSYGREDLLAGLLLYEGNPPRIRADKTFLLRRVEKLP